MTIDIKVIYQVQYLTGNKSLSYDHVRGLSATNRYIDDIIVSTYGIDKTYTELFDGE